MAMPRWKYEPAPNIEWPLLERLRRFPREPDLLVGTVRCLVALLLRAWLRFYHGFTVIGRENLPTDQSFVVIANHTSHLDALCLLSALPIGKLDCAFPAAARDYFFVGLPRLLAAAVVANALPFDRHKDVRGSLDLCRDVLKTPGNILVVFPEGSRSTTGEVGEFKAGIGLLVAGSRHPVVPCYPEGSQDAWPKGSWLPRPRRMRLLIGKPRAYAYADRTTSAAHRISRELRQAVVTLAAGASAPARFVPLPELSA
jgi:1-acyl-sn-glycerol-3-phosphate acyltransferase